ncbi:MAG TPA: DMT family transporter [Candidatus Xenobia bacterium]|nr:DMT family transporter [Candidatus Xenobia bacterium]
MSVPSSVKADLALTGVVLVWGTSFVIVKEALADASPLMFLLLRFGVASLVLLPLFGRRLSWREPGALRAGLLVGLCLFAGFLFQTVGLQHTTPSKSAFITSLSVPLVPLILAALAPRQLRARALLGIATATVGMYFLTIPAGSFSIERGDLITFFCAVGFACHIVALGRYAPRFGCSSIAVSQVLTAFMLLLLVAPVAGSAGWDALDVRWSANLWFALGVTAVLGTALAFSVQTWAQQYTSATHAAVLFSLEPVFAAAFSYLMVGERLGGRGFVGAALILAGVLVTELAGNSTTPANPAAGERV